MHSYRESLTHVFYEKPAQIFEIEFKLEGNGGSCDSTIAEKDARILPPGTCQVWGALKSRF